LKKHHGLAIQGLVCKIKYLVLVLTFAVMFTSLVVVIVDVVVVVLQWSVLLQMRSPGELSYTYDANQIQRELIAQLEAKNR